MATTSELSELHVQPVGWDQSRTRFAVLLLEGEAPDRSNGGAVLADALFRFVLARGLRLTTDLDHLALALTPGWRAHLGQTGGMTLRWPHHAPLLADVPSISPTAGPGPRSSTALCSCSPATASACTNTVCTSTPATARLVPSSACRTSRKTVHSPQALSRSLWQGQAVIDHG